MNPFDGAASRATCRRRPASKRSLFLVFARRANVSAGVLMAGLGGFAAAPPGEGLAGFALRGGGGGAASDTRRRRLCHLSEPAASRVISVFQ